MLGMGRKPRQPQPDHTKTHATPTNANAALKHEADAAPHKGANATDAKPKSRRWLVWLLRGLWVAAAVLLVESLLISLRPGYVRLSTICSEPVCPPDQLTPIAMASLQAIGWGASAYAIYFIALTLLVTVISAGVSLIIFRDQPDAPMALYVALELLVFPFGISGYVDVLWQLYPSLQWMIILIQIASAIGFMALPLVLPDGRFVPRWTRWAVWAWVSLPVVLLLITAAGFEPLVDTVIRITVISLLMISVFAPLYRYRSATSYVQRQQSKWVIVGLVQLVAVFLIREILSVVMPELNIVGTLPNLIGNAIHAVSLCLMPVTLGVAILRYRLWDVDLLINRTLVYIPLTSILTVIYATSISVSQTIFRSVTGDNSPAIAIFTTIILTATFTPLKNSLQTFVDRTFKEAPDPLKEMRELAKQVDQVAAVLNSNRLAQQVVEQAARACGAEGGALYVVDPAQSGPALSGLAKPGVMRLLYATPDWQVDKVSLILTDGETLVGRLLLGPKQNGEEYTEDECKSVEATAAHILYHLQFLRQLTPGGSTLSAQAAATGENQSALRSSRLAGPLVPHGSAPTFTPAPDAVAPE